MDLSYIQIGLCILTPLHVLVRLEDRDVPFERRAQGGQVRLPTLAPAVAAARIVVLQR
jgi:hypothetical protein